MSLADVQVGMDDARTARRLTRARLRFARKTRAQIAAFMKPYGFDYDPADKSWTKSDAWDEYEGILRAQWRGL